MVPYFDPVPIEVPYSFGLMCGFALASMFGLAKRKTIGVGTLIVLLPFLPLSNGPKIDHFSHSVALDGNGLRFSSALPWIRNITAKCADTLAERCLYGELHKIAPATVWPILAVIQYTVG
jgi:hypothetical protein